jgi:hypothetical protein
MTKKLPIHYQSCETSLLVSPLSCELCETTISGKYSLPILLQVITEEQDFVFQFILFGESLKKMAAQLVKSYPSVRNKLDDINEKMNQLT